MKKERRPAKPALNSLLIALATYAALAALLSAAISPERYDLRVGEVATITIRATKDVEDTISTQHLIDAAVRSVQPSYISDAEVLPRVMENLTAAFERMKSLPALAAGVDTGRDGVSAQLVQQAAEVMVPAELTEGSLRALLTARGETLESLGQSAMQLVRDTLNAKLPEGQEAEAIEKLSRDLLSAGFSDPLVSAAAAVARAYIEPNMLLDEETTELNRQKAADEVQAVVYKTGQNIVRAGEVVTAPQIEMLNNLGMLKDRAVDFSLYVGLGLLLALLLLMVVAYLYTFENELLRDPRRVALLCLIAVTVISFSLLVRTLNSYLMPVALGAMLITLLIKPRLAMVVNFALAVLTGLMASIENGLFTATTLCVMLNGILGGSACVVVVKRRQQRANVLLAGAIVSVVNAASTIAIGLINSGNLNNVLIWALWAAGGGLMSAILCIGLQPALEWLFNLVTSAKLMELSNPNQPLLRRLLLEAPGTYHHSIIVANLAEAAAGAVGADGLLARVGAYYHDIGKLKRPLYFKENQLHDNPHDRTDPRVSTAILTSHPRDGVEMAQKARLPGAIIDIIQQHHGDTPVLYFYDKAAKQGEAVDVADFRYDGPRPRSREAAIVMLADTVEAAARAANDSSPDKMALLIRRLVRSKMEDGQLDECSLTFADLNLICEAFLTVLSGVYHERIEYPEISIPKRPLPEAVDEKVERAVEQAEKHNPERKLEKPPEKSTAKPAEKAAEKPPEKPPEKAPERPAEKPAAAKPVDKPVEKPPEKAADKAPERAPRPSPEPEDRAEAEKRAPIEERSENEAEA